MTGIEEVVGVAALGGPIAQLLAIFLVVVVGALGTVTWLVNANYRSQIKDQQKTIESAKKTIDRLSGIIEQRSLQLQGVVEKTNEVLSGSNVSLIRLRDTLKAVQEELVKIKEKCHG